LRELRTSTRGRKLTLAQTIGGDCFLPAGAYTADNGRSLTLTGMIASLDCAHLLERTMSAKDAEGLGKTRARKMLRLGGAAILRSATT
jgi:porphobilinogen deaminase